MVRSLCVSALLILSAVARGSKEGDARKLVELAKRAGTAHQADGQPVKRAEAVKLARRQQGGVRGGSGFIPGTDTQGLQPYGQGFPPGQTGQYPGPCAPQGLPPGQMSPYGSRGCPPGQMGYNSPGYPYGQGQQGGPGADVMGASGGFGMDGSSGYGSGVVQGMNGMGGPSGYGTGLVPGMDPTGGYGAGVGGPMSGVLGGYSNLLGQVQNCQSALAAGGISAQMAMQQVQQLAVQFEATISQFLACSMCYASNSIGSFGGVFSSLFSAFYSLVSSYQQIFPNNYTSMFSGPFSGLNSLLASFLSVCQSSGLSVNKFFPQPLGSFLGQVGLTSVSNQLQQLGYPI